MKTLYHQLQGLYVAGDVMTALDSARALPEYRHVLFVNHTDGYVQRLHDTAVEHGIEVRPDALVDPDDLTPDVRAVLYHCVGYDDRRRDGYVRFGEEPPGVLLGAWIHTPGLCGSWAERYNFLNGSGVSTLIFNSSFSLHATPGLDPAAFARRVVISPAVDADLFSGITRSEDRTFRLGRWSRGDDAKYPDDFLDLVAAIDVPDAEVVCMGVPGKLRGQPLPPHVRLYENGEIPLELLLARLDVLFFNTDARSWHEGWCRTVTEAMAAGVVPVVENRGGIPDQVLHGFNGFLCNDNADFVRYCRLLHDDPALRARMAANARAFVCQEAGLPSLRQRLLDLLEPRPPRRLNLGCGLDPWPGWVNADLLPLPGVDVVLESDPWRPRLPFDDAEFDEIVAYHVLEHVANKNAILQELWRIARHNAVLRVKLPDRQHSDAFLDPTHLSFWEADTIDFYLPGHERSYYSAAKFGLLSKYTTGREIFWELLALHHGPRFPVSHSTPEPEPGIRTA